MEGKNPFPVTQTRVIFNQNWLDIAIANARIQDRATSIKHPVTGLPSFSQNHLNVKRLAGDCAIGTGHMIVTVKKIFNDNVKVQPG